MELALFHTETLSERATIANVLVRIVAAIFLAERAEAATASRAAASERDAAVEVDKGLRGTDQRDRSAEQRQQIEAEDVVTRLHTHAHT